MTANEPPAPQLDALMDLLFHGITVVPPPDGDPDGLTMTIDYTEPAE